MCSSETELPAQHRRTSLWQVSLWIFWGPKPRSPWWLQALPLPVLRDVTAVRTTHTHTHLQGNEWIQQFYFLNVEFIQMFKSFSLSVPCRFSDTCFLDVDNQPTCDACRPGYAGRRCERWRTTYQQLCLSVLFEIGNGRNTTGTVRAHNSRSTPAVNGFSWIHHPTRFHWNKSISFETNHLQCLVALIVRKKQPPTRFLFISSTADKCEKMWMKCFISSDECSHFSFHFRCAPGYQGNPLLPNGKCVPNRKYQDFWSSSNMKTSSPPLCVKDTVGFHCFSWDCGVV